LTGEELLKNYKVPDAERFSVNFCSNCGSSMPKFIESSSFAVVPAGTVDNQLNMKPTASIFQNSRLDWSCSDSGIPAYEEYPK